MADCNETLAELWSFFDDHLSDETRAEVQSHLGECTDCLQAFDFYAELRAVVAKCAQNDEIPPSLMTKIQACFSEVFAETEQRELRSES